METTTNKVKLTKLQRGIMVYIQKNNGYTFDKRNKRTTDMLLERGYITEQNGQYILTDFGTEIISTPE